MGKELFADARLKIKRGDEHVGELQRRLEAFLDTDFYSLGVEQNEEIEEYILQFEVTTPIPEDIPLIIGDAMHNLRTALDYVAFELVDRAGGSTDHVKFPVRRNRNELEAALRGGEINAAGADVVDLILNVIQPYTAGDGASIFVLHSLDIGDKHLHLTPVVSVVALRNVKGTAGPLVFDDCTFAVGEGGILSLLAMPEHFRFQGHGEPAFAVLFGEGQPFAGEPVVPTLHQLSQLVSGTVQAIEDVYLTTN